jgi:hypothetical protein
MWSLTALEGVLVFDVMLGFAYDLRIYDSCTRRNTMFMLS